MHYNLIVVGGGFGGLNTVRHLKNSSLKILLIDRLNHHLFQPLLYEVATAALSPGEIAVPLREIVQKQKNVTVIMGEVAEVHLDRKDLLLRDHKEIFSYDQLVLSVGARHSYFGNPQWEAFAPGLKTLQDALSLREQLLSSFEKAERLQDSAEIAKYLTFVIIGAGPTGIEMAGAIADICTRTLAKDFRHINSKTAQIYLLEALPEILSSYPPRLSARVRADLHSLGVTVWTGKKVTDIREDGVQVEGTFIPAKNVIWAAGNQASPLLKTLQVPLDRQGRVLVEPDLSVPGHREVFVIGDAACATQAGKPLPSVAPVAIQQGCYIAKNLRIPPQKRPPFVYHDKGSMATIGKGKAVAFIGKLQFTGFFAWLMWAFVHVLYLIGFRNRFSVLIQWLIILVSGQRGVRILHHPIDDPKNGS